MAVLELPDDLKNALARQGYIAYRRPGHFIAGRTIIEAQGKRWQGEANQIEWTEYDYRLKREVTNTYHIGTINASQLGGAGDGYLLTLENVDTRDAFAIALYGVNRNDIVFEMDPTNIASLARRMSGEDKNYTTPGGIWPLIFFLIGCVTITIYIGIVIIALVIIFVTWHEKKYKFHGKNRVPKISAARTRTLFRDIMVYVLKNVNFREIWMKENFQKRDPRLSQF